VTYNSILDIVGRQLSDMSVLQEIIDDMFKAGITPDVVTYSILIKASCSGGNLQNALLLFRQFQSKGLAFDQVAFNTLLLACSKADQIADAEDIFEEMCRLGLRPTHITASIMVKMYGKAKMVDKAIHIAEAIEKDHGLKPNLHVYTCLIQACTQNKQVRHSWEIFNKMVSSGVVPDAITYGTVMHGCVYLKKFSYAMSLVRHAYKLPAPRSSFIEADAAFVAMPQLKQAVPLQQEVLQMLLTAMRRKDEHVLSAELEGIMASYPVAPTDTGRQQGGKQNYRPTRGPKQPIASRTY